MIYELKHGPYINKENRRIVFVLIPTSSKLKCISYAKYLYSEFLGRELLPEETVDHIDNDKMNDVVENFQLLSVKENILKSVVKADISSYICPCCNTKFEKQTRRVKGNRNQGKAGPYCSKRCAGKMHH